MFLTHSNRPAREGSVIQSRAVRRPPIVAMLPVALLLLLLPAVDSPPIPDVLRAVPDLPRDLLQHLTYDTDAQLRSYAKRTGTQDLRAAIGLLESAGHKSSKDAHERTYLQVRATWRRAAWALADVFGLDFYARELGHLDSLSSSERWQWSQAGWEAEALVWQEPKADTTQPRRILELMKWAEGHGHWRLLARIHMRLGHGHWIPSTWRERRGHLLEAIRIRRESGDHLLYCNDLGIYVFRDTTLSNSARFALLDSGLTVARRHGLVDQESRLLEFQASVARAEGRLVTERRLRIEAVEAWNGIEGSGQRARALFSLIQFFAALDCWDEVSVLVQRAEPYLVKLQSVGRHSEFDLARVNLGCLRAQRLLEEGRPNEAWQVLSDFDPAALRDSLVVPLPLLYCVLGQAAVAMGRDRQARSLLEKDIEICRNRLDFETLAQSHLMLARGLLRDGEAESAVKLLDEFDRSPEAAALRPATRVALLAGLARAEARAGDRARARSTLARALDTLWAAAHRNQVGSEVYLALGEPPELREALHGLIATTPAQGYGAELALRGWAKALGGMARGERVPRWRPEAIAHLPRLGAGEAHILFAFVDERLLRWTATPSGVSLDTLPGGPLIWRQRMRELGEALSDRPDSASRHDRARVMLGTLAMELLPELVRRGEGIRRLYFSPAGPLAALPFEALDLGSGGTYRPLASVLEVAIVRGLGVERVPAREVAVLAAPALSMAQRRQFPSLLELDESNLESVDVKELWPSARVLTGESATKSAVLESWRDAGLIHIAAHLVRLVEIPYYDFIPLAPEPVQPGDATLELADVRRHDLSRCELVVLSTCASGQPYVAHRRVGPSMADAFLDAGAHSVLRTMRPVSDVEARRFVAAFLHEWRANGHDAVAAAHVTRRRLFTDGALATSPATWMAWSVAVNLAERGATSPRPAIAAGFAVPPGSGPR